VAGVPGVGAYVIEVNQVKDQTLGQGVTEQVRVHVVKKHGTRHGNE
jgi:hypothetical protein